MLDPDWYSNLSTSFWPDATCYIAFRARPIWHRHRHRHARGGGGDNSSGAGLLSKRMMTDDCMTA